MIKYEDFELFEKSRRSFGRTKKADFYVSFARDEIIVHFPKSFVENGKTFSIMTNRSAMVVFPSSKPNSFAYRSNKCAIDYQIGSSKLYEKIISEWGFTKEKLREFKNLIGKEDVLPDGTPCMYFNKGDLK